MTDAEIAEFRALRGQGMTSCVGEYTPSEFWDALDEIERLRGIVPEVLETLNDELCAENERLRAELAEAVTALPQAVRNERARWAELLRSWLDDAERESGPEAAGWLEKAIEQLEKPR